MSAVVPCGGLLEGANFSLAMEILEGQRFVPNTHSICSPQHLFWRLDFLMESNSSLCLSVPVVLNEAKMKSTCHETILLPLTSHRSVKFINTLKAEQPLFIWQTALQNMTAPHFPTLRSHPNLQLVSTCKKKKKKISKSNLLMSATTYQYLPFPEKGWVTRQDN